jgi:hypothetical protein
MFSAPSDAPQLHPNSVKFIGSRAIKTILQRHRADLAVLNDVCNS